MPIQNIFPVAADFVFKIVLKYSIRKALKKASASTMKTMGYVIKAENSWVIREDLDGTKIKLRKIEKSSQPIILD